MSEAGVVVRRSAFLMWFLAVLGVPFVIYGVDLLFQRRLANWLKEWIYQSDAAPGFETHDLAWAWIFLAVGVVFTGWALKELIAPRSVIVASEDELTMALAGPFARNVSIPWDSVGDVSSAVDTDDRGRHPVLRLQLLDPEVVPSEPWGARWVSDDTLSISANDWDASPQDVVELLTELALSRATAADEQEQPEQSESTEEAESPDESEDAWIDMDDSDRTPLLPTLVDGPWVRPDAELTEGERQTDSTDDDEAEPSADSEEDPPE